MKIGICGVGIVGSAVKFGMELLNHEVIVYDIKLPETKVEDLFECEVVFICVPTPSLPNGECDTSIVESVVDKIFLSRKEYQPTTSGYKVKLPRPNQIIAIKSTVEPGTTEKLNQKYNKWNDEHGLCFAFVPEFLKERSATIDFTERHDVCVIGCETDKVYDKIKEAHGDLPQSFVRLSFTEAELAKYFNNIYNATLITFANSFYEVCQKKCVSYSKIKNAMTKRNHICKEYLECNDKWRGFQGMCLPKDTKAIAYLMKDTNVRFFDMLLEENEKYPPTSPEGMRK